jgi:hypothetical protein
MANETTARLNTPTVSARRLRALGKVQAVRHEWQRRTGTVDVFDCLHCRMWTANEPLYRNDICPARDRRKTTKDRRNGA